MLRRSSPVSLRSIPQSTPPLASDDKQRLSPTSNQHRRLSVPNQPDSPLKQSVDGKYSTITDDAHVRVPRLSIAPMVDVTETYFRLMNRVISQNTTVYTEMIVDKQLLNSFPMNRSELGVMHPIESCHYKDNIARIYDTQRIKEQHRVYHLDNSLTTSQFAVDASSSPITVIPSVKPLPNAKKGGASIAQISGADAHELSYTATLLQNAGFDGININMGCPASSAQNGLHGALMMITDGVARQLQRLRSNPNIIIPISIKCRVGVNKPADYQWFYNWLTNMISETGISHYILHSRIALLKKNPKSNLNVPPLQQQFIHWLQNDVNHFIHQERETLFHIIDTYIQQNPTKAHDAIAYLTSSSEDSAQCGDPIPFGVTGVNKNACMYYYNRETKRKHYVPLSVCFEYNGGVRDFTTSVRTVYALDQENGYRHRESSLVSSTTSVDDDYLWMRKSTETPQDGAVACETKDLSMKQPLVPGMMVGRGDANDILYPLFYDAFHHALVLASNGHVDQPHKLADSLQGRRGGPASSDVQDDSTTGNDSPSRVYDNMDQVVESSHYTTFAQRAAELTPGKRGAAITPQLLLEIVQRYRNSHAIIHDSGVYIDPTTGKWVKSEQDKQDAAAEHSPLLSSLSDEEKMKLIMPNPALHHIPTPLHTPPTGTTASQRALENPSRFDILFRYLNEVDQMVFDDDYAFERHLAYEIDKSSRQDAKHQLDHQERDDSMEESQSDDSTMHITNTIRKQPQLSKSPTTATASSPLSFPVTRDNSMQLPLFSTNEEQSIELARNHGVFPFDAHAMTKTISNLLNPTWQLTNHAYLFDIDEGEESFATSIEAPVKKPRLVTKHDMTDSETEHEEEHTPHKPSTATHPFVELITKMVCMKELLDIAIVYDSLKYHISEAESHAAAAAAATGDNQGEHPAAKKGKKSTATEDNMHIIADLSTLVTKIASIVPHPYYYKQLNPANAGSTPPAAHSEQGLLSSAQSTSWLHGWNDHTSVERARGWLETVKQHLHHHHQMQHSHIPTATRDNDNGGSFAQPTSSQNLHEFVMTFKHLIPSEDSTQHRHGAQGKGRSASPGRAAVPADQPISVILTTPVIRSKLNNFIARLSRYAQCQGVSSIPQGYTFSTADLFLRPLFSLFANTCMFVYPRVLIYHPRLESGNEQWRKILHSASMISKGQHIEVMESSLFWTREESITGGLQSIKPKHVEIIKRFKQRQDDLFSSSDQMDSDTSNTSAPRPDAPYTGWVYVGNNGDRTDKGKLSKQFQMDDVEYATEHFLFKKDSMALIPHSVVKHLTQQMATNISSSNDTSEDGVTTTHGDESHLIDLNTSLPGHIPSSFTADRDPTLMLQHFYAILHKKYNRHVHALNTLAQQYIDYNKKAFDVYFNNYYHYLHISHEEKQSDETHYKYLIDQYQLELQQQAKEQHTHKEQDTQPKTLQQVLSSSLTGIRSPHDCVVPYNQRTLSLDYLHYKQQLLDNIPKHIHLSFLARFPYDLSLLDTSIRDHMFSLVGISKDLYEESEFKYLGQRSSKHQQYYHEYNRHHFHDSSTPAPDTAPASAPAPIYRTSLDLDLEAYHLRNTPHHASWIFTTLKQFHNQDTHPDQNGNVTTVVEPHSATQNVASSSSSTQPSTDTQRTLAASNLQGERYSRLPDQFIHQDTYSALIDALPVFHELCEQYELLTPTHPFHLIMLHRQNIHQAFTYLREQIRAIDAFVLDDQLSTLDPSDRQDILRKTGLCRELLRKPIVDEVCQRFLYHEATKMLQLMNRD